MCGITGIYSRNISDSALLDNIHHCINALKHRGPDYSSVWRNDSVALGHTRLSIIDTSAASHQPFADGSGRYIIAFNGEIFNYKELRAQLEQRGICFRSNGDVEVLLEMYKWKKEKALDEIRGFFAMAVYDQLQQELFLARDRFGVKPLYYFINEHQLIFASEISAIRQAVKKMSLNYGATSIYFQLNYFAGETSVFSEIKKIPAGHWAIINSSGFNLTEFYSVRKRISNQTGHSDAKHTLSNLLTKSVEDRMTADVQVGSFLSGGIDSTIIAGLASKVSRDLSTFCLGFRDNKWFDESPFAEIAAKHFKTNHHTFMIGQEEMLAELDNFLDALDEPFADSSALNFFILSKKTKQHVKVVLSGDGADEIFAGYNKHRAAWLLKNSKTLKLASKLGPLLTAFFPASRNSWFGNRIRQIEKFCQLYALSFQDQYWRMASVSEEKEVEQRFNSPALILPGKEIKSSLLNGLDENSGINGILLKDIEMVLEGDMLVKADRMSMRHGLEVRNPFLDHRLIEWALSLPENKIINGQQGKLILRQTFRNLIPEALLNRKKHGFELPLHSWMKNELRSKVEKIYLNKDFILSQNIFNFEAIEKLKQKLFSNNPGDAPAKVWAILVFNHWYMKNEAHFN